MPVWEVLGRRTDGDVFAVVGGVTAPDAEMALLLARRPQHIEEDLAFSSIAQDELAHARLLYGLVGAMTGQGEDELAFGRAPAEYRNAVLCERPNGDWGYSLARQYLYDTADAVRLATLARSAWKELADVVAVIRLEERYHLEHARVWFERMA